MTFRTVPGYVADMIPGGFGRLAPRRTRSSRVGLALSLAIASLALGGCSLVLDFDTPTDAPPPDGPVTEAQCMFGEPNDTPGQATAFEGADIDAGICGNGDHDHYRITLVDGQSIRARITFMNRGGAGDLELRLLSADGSTTLDESRTSGDTEEVLCPGGSPCPALAAGDYLVDVFGFAESVQAPYVLHVELTGP